MRVSKTEFYSGRFSQKSYFELDGDQAAEFLALEDDSERAAYLDENFYAEDSDPIEVQKFTESYGAEVKW